MVLSEMNFKISIEVWTAHPLHLLCASLCWVLDLHVLLFVTLISELQLPGWKLAASGMILMFWCTWFTCMCMKRSCWIACCKPCLCFRCVTSMKLFPVESWGWCSGQHVGLSFQFWMLHLFMWFWPIFRKTYVCTHSDHRFALCVEKGMLNYTLQVFDFLELIANIPNQHFYSYHTFY